MPSAPATCCRSALARTLAPGTEGKNGLARRVLSLSLLPERFQLPVLFRVH